MSQEFTSPGGRLKAGRQAAFHSGTGGGGGGVLGGGWWSDNGGALPTLPPRAGKKDLHAPAHEDAWKSHEPIQSEWKNNQMGSSGQGPQPLKMFMSAREIKSEYQPLDGDRQEAYDEREGQATSRLETTAGKPNARLTTYDKEEGFAKYRTNTSDTHYRQYGHSETDEQLWGRKLNESQMSYSEYADVHGGGVTNRTPGYETLAGRASAPQPPGSSGWSESGAQRSSAWEQHDYDQAQYVQRKLDEHYQEKDHGSLYGTLHEAMRPGGVGFTGHVHLGSQFGESGKRQVVGAHHRIAAMEDIDSDRLLPVVHHRSIMDARAGFAGLPYT